MPVEYSPGGWALLAGPGRWLLVQLSASQPLVARCWPLIERGAALDDILGVIAHEGLRAVGSFAAVSRQNDGSVRAIVRGAASVDVTPLSGSVTELRALAVATWLDRVVDAPIAGVVIRGDEPPEAARLPLVCGAALASAVWIARSCADPPKIDPSAPAQAAPAPAAAPGPSRGQVADTTHRLHRLVQLGTDTPVPEPEPRPVPQTPASSSAHGQPAAAARSVAPIPGTSPEPQRRQAVRPDTSPTARTGEGLIGEDPRLPPPKPTPARPPSWSELSGAAVSSVAASGSAGPQPATAGQPLDEPVRTQIRRAAGPRTVSAVLCLEGHLNPPDALECRDCGEAVPPAQHPRDVPRPALGVLRPVAGGEPILLERDVVLGRDPRGSFAPGGPNVIRVQSPNLEVSATHLAVGLDGWTVVVEDLGSSNGTTVAGEDGTVRQLRPHERVVIEPGAVVTLGGEVALRYEPAHLDRSRA